MNLRQRAGPMIREEWSDRVRIILRAIINQELRINQVTIIIATRVQGRRAVTKVPRLPKALVAEIKITALQGVLQAPDKPTAQAQRILTDQVLLPAEFQVQATVLRPIQLRVTAHHPGVLPARAAAIAADHQEADRAIAAAEAEAAVEVEGNFCFNHSVTLT